MRDFNPYFVVADRSSTFSYCIRARELTIASGGCLAKFRNMDRPAVAIFEVNQNGAS
jgi:hypothetical protein